MKKRLLSRRREDQEHLKPQRIRAKKERGRRIQRMWEDDERSQGKRRVYIGGMRCHCHFKCNESIPKTAFSRYSSPPTTSPPPYRLPLTTYCPTPFFSLFLFIIFGVQKFNNIFHKHKDIYLIVILRESDTFYNTKKYFLF